MFVVQLAYLAFVSIALPDSMLGVAWPSMRLSFDQLLSAAGLVPPVGVAASVVATIAAPYLAARWGVGRLLAAGTGMAQMHSLIEHCRAAGFSHPVHLYWGVRHPDDFYQLPHWQDWEQQAGLQLHRVVSEAAAWGGRCGLLHEAVCEDFPDLKALHVYASGSPAMVYGTLDALVEAGMDPHQMRADVFAYAPRE